MIYTRDKTFTSEVFCKFQALLNGEADWDSLSSPEKERDSITVTSVSMGDGYEIDFNVVRGHDKPYLDVVLFENGNEFYTWEIRDHLGGCWETVFGGDIQKAFRVETFVE